MQPIEEQWRAIPGHEDLWEVSDQGRIRSLDRIASATGRGDGKYLVPGRVMKQQLQAGKPTKQYLMVTLGCRGAGVAPKRIYVHQVVALAFIGPCPNGQVVRHLDDNQLDNRLANLAYGTPKQNMADQLVNTGHHYGDRTHCTNGHEFTPENIEWRTDAPNSRRCIICAKARRRARHERAKARQRADLETNPQ